jgi:hypothetical protein
MPKVVVTHNVADVEKWLSFKAERAESIRAGLGGTEVQDYVAQDGSNAVAIGAVIDDLDAALKALAAPPPELGSVMEKHGVVPPLNVYVER